MNNLALAIEAEAWFRIYILIDHRPHRPADGVFPVSFAVRREGFIQWEDSPAW